MKHTLFWGVDYDLYSLKRVGASNEKAKTRDVPAAQRKREPA
jgi:hypothetical protein